MTEYEVVPAGPEDRRDVLDFVAEHFIPHEPINSAINLVQPGYRIPYFDTWLGNHLSKEETLTLLARDVTTGQMLGVCIVQLQRSQEKSDSPPPEDEAGPCYSVCPDKLRTIFEFLDMLKGGLDLERESGVEEWCEVMILVCRSDQRTPGLGTVRLDIWDHQISHSLVMLIIHSSSYITLFIYIIHYIHYTFILITRSSSGGL